ncbi:hypothetical protein BC831DRAFT_444151 [Entophlyctis helioformis]|nr:hypothetical protein BC831DRAFT_444151 [Entophlyctis helioformis]
MDTGLGLHAAGSTTSSSSNSTASSRTRYNTDTLIALQPAQRKQAAATADHSGARRPARSCTDTTCKSINVASAMPLDKATEPAYPAQQPPPALHLHAAVPIATFLDDDSDADIVAVASPQDRDTVHALEETAHAMARASTSDSVSARTLLVVRLAVASFSTAFIALRITHFDQPYEYTYFLTNWTWIGMTLYFWLASWATWRYALNSSMFPRSIALPLSSSSMPSQDESAALDNTALLDHRKYKRRPSRLFVVVHQQLYAAAHVFNWIVPPVYWLILMEDFTNPVFTRIKVASVVIEHSLGLVFLLMDLGLNRMRVTAINLVPVLACLALYLGWVWVLQYAFGVEWPYFFLEQFFDVGRTSASRVSESHEPALASIQNERIHH